MNSMQVCVVIQGIREDGQRFRPSDWIERVASVMAGFDADRRLRYDSLLRPEIINGEKCLVVDGALADTSPDVYSFVLEFARCNHLKMEVEGYTQAIAA